MSTYLLPWNMKENGQIYFRTAHNKKYSYNIVYNSNKWWAWNDEKSNSVPYDTIDEAMNALDDCLRKRGYILLTEEMVMLL